MNPSLPPPRPTLPHPVACTEGAMCHISVKNGVNLRATGETYVALSVAQLYCAHSETREPQPLVAPILKPP